MYILRRDSHTDGHTKYITWRYPLYIIYETNTDYNLPNHILPYDWRRRKQTWDSLPGPRLPSLWGRNGIWVSFDGDVDEQPAGSCIWLSCIISVNVVDGRNDDQSLYSLVVIALIQIRIYIKRSIWSEPLKTIKMKNIFQNRLNPLMCVMSLSQPK